VEEEYQVASGYPRTKTYMLDAWALVLAWIVTVVALGWLGMGVRGTVFMLLVWAMLSVVIIGRPILLWLFKRLRPSLFSTRALEAAIEGVLGSGSLAVPTYVTLARRVRWFDPDKPNVLLSRSVRVIGFPIGEAFIPRYERIDGRPMEDVYRLLLGSASLPEGVFPPLRIDGVEYVDGGAADNTPVFPLIETDPCDEVWILGLRPSEYTKQSMSKGYLRAWKAIERRLRLCAVGVDACKELFHQYVPEHGLYTAYTLPRRRGSLVPEREPMHWPHRIIEITPRTQLGGFFSGTLNFRKNYAEQLFLLGYSDGRDAVTKYLGSGRE